MSRELPATPNLEHLKKQAKQLLCDFQEGKAEAVARFGSFASHSTPDNAKLADAQYIIARDYGFANWPKLKDYVDSFTLTPVAASRGHSRRQQRPGRPGAGATP